MGLQNRSFKLENQLYCNMAEKGLHDCIIHVIKNDTSMTNTTFHARIDINCVFYNFSQRSAASCNHHDHGHNSSHHHLCICKRCRDKIGEIFINIPKTCLLVNFGTCHETQIVSEHHGPRRTLWRYVHSQNEAIPSCCIVDFLVMSSHLTRISYYDHMNVCYLLCFCIIVYFMFVKYAFLMISDTKNIRSNAIEITISTFNRNTKIILLNLVLILVSSNQIIENANLRRERKISQWKQYLSSCLSKNPISVNNDTEKDVTLKFPKMFHDIVKIFDSVKTENGKSFLYDIINHCQLNRSDSVIVYPVTGNATMSSELMRLGTLHNFPPENAPSLIRLAAAGFYFEGKGREVTCFSCGVKYDNWSNNSVPLELHRQISPNCNFIKELCAEHKQENSSCQTTSYSQQHTEAHFSAPRPAESDFIRACTDPDDNLQTSLLISSSGIPVSVQNGVDSGLYHSNQSYPRSSIQTSRRGQSSLLTSASRDSRFYTDSSSTRSSDSGYASSGYSSSQSNNVLASGQPMLSVLPEGQEQSLQTTPSARDSPLPLASQQKTLVKEKYPEYIPIERRRATFKNWPESINFLHPLDLAECGFFYTNFGDCVRCFHCGIGLRNWESDDNPWVEHARWSRKCPYLQVKKGQEFIDNVLKVLGLQTDAEIEQQVTTAATGQTETRYDKNQANNVLDPLLHPAAQYVIREQIFGSNKDRQVKMVMNQLLQVRDWNDITNDILVNAFLENKDGLEFMETKPSNENLSASNTKSSSSEPTVKNSSSNDKGETNADDPEKIQKENEELKDLYTCKICLDERVGITFVPCGHLVTCRNCSPKIRRCPLCRTFIRGTIKTTM